MSAAGTIIVLGLGEVGRPVLDIASRHHRTVGVDIAPPTEPIERVDVMHVCYPFEIKDFVGETARYIERFRPALTVINSTVGVGTTRAIAERTGAPVVHSPVRGKHARMREEILGYTKFIGALDPASGRRASEHFESLGMRTRTLASPEATELAKLSETTYFGLLIAWAQELERYGDQVGVDYNEITSFYEEIKFFPSTRYFPGVIGGHCVMPNIEILSKLANSDILDAIRSSNQKKVERDGGSGPAAGRTGLTSP
jgi:UDP-N-acetyl-D-mannosaminuronate dehydrogenase